MLRARRAWRADTTPEATVCRAPLPHRAVRCCAAVATVAVALTLLVPLCLLALSAAAAVAAVGTVVGLALLCLLLCLLPCLLPCVSPCACLARLLVTSMQRRLALASADRVSAQ
jgi:hypothetical protein